MVIVGCAMPFRIPLNSEPVEFSTGAFRSVIQRHAYVELVVNHIWKEHLASTVHGLTLWENFFGLYFRADLPDTPYANQIYQGIVDKKIHNVCALSSSTETEPHGDTLVVREANLYAINLLVTAPPHCDQAWVSWEGPAAEKRIHQEDAKAQDRHLWSLDKEQPV